MKIFIFHHGLSKAGLAKTTAHKVLFLVSMDSKRSKDLEESQILALGCLLTGSGWLESIRAIMAPPCSKTYISDLALDRVKSPFKDSSKIHQWLQNKFWFFPMKWLKNGWFLLGSFKSKWLPGVVADTVIKAIARLEFEDGFRMGVLHGGCLCPCGGHTYPRINIKPSLGCGLVLGWVWLSEVPHFRPNSNSAEFHAWVVSNYSSYVVLG